MNYLDKTKVERQIKMLNKQLEKYEVGDQHKAFNFFGGEAYGYIRGKIFVLEELLDQLEESTCK